MKKLEAAQFFEKKLVGSCPIGSTKISAGFHYENRRFLFLA